MARAWRGHRATGRQPRLVRGLATAFGKPHAGRITWVLGAPDQSAIVPCSNVFDPFPRTCYDSWKT